jgi:broad specificity phosphatase PhoE
MFTTVSKELWILRHGQAVHNPRAEAARERGCSYEEFMEWMKLDDCLDAPLTEMGREQIRQSCWNSIKSNNNNCEQRQKPHLQNNHINGNNTHHSLQMIVSSPLSRALETADLAVCPQTYPHIPRICYEGFREINGYLQNAQRRSKTELQDLFPHWNFEQIQSDHDDTWTPEQLESELACGERGYQGLQWLLHHNHQQPEQQQHQHHQRILLVAHGGILRFMFQHPHVQLMDARNNKQHLDQNNHNHASSSSKPRSVHDRFGNGELRRYILSCRSNSASCFSSSSSANHDDDNPMVMVLTELDLVETAIEHTATGSTTNSAKEEESNTMASSSSATTEAMQ